ncbi:hypothetical protein GUITHDRAFT_67024, partial [Guillardia theta CCMP2712]
IGRTMTESWTLDHSWVRCAQRVDELWVPSKWHVEAFKNAGIPEDKLMAIPEAVDTEFFDPALAKKQERHSDDLVLLSVFKWEHRKGWDVLLDAYWSAFTPQDKVVLKIRSYIPSWEGGLTEMHARVTQYAKMESPNRGGPTIQEGALSRAEMRDLYASSDVMVLPTRGEGWGLPIVEAMAMELPVIVTNFSGPTEYLTESNSYPIGYSMVERHSHMYAEPDFDQLVSTLRHVFANAKDRAAKGKRARQDMVKRFSPSVVVDQMIDRANFLLSNKTRI